jgi:acyl-CoA thioesterase FadM
VKENAPLPLYEGKVQDQWIDEFGHMNMSRYVEACDYATYAFWELVNAPNNLEAREGAEYAVVEAHLNYMSELRKGDPIRVTTQLLAADSKRFQLFHCLYNAGTEELVASNEIMALGFNLKTRSLMSFHPHVLARIEDILAKHADLPQPKNAGRAIGLRRKG